MNADNFIVLYEKERPIAILQKAFHIILVDEVNADSTLEFDIHFMDKKRAFLHNQIEVHICNQAYIIKTVTDKKESSGTKITHVYAENTFYNLARASKLQDTIFDKAKLKSVLAFALQNTDWTIGNIEVTSVKSFESTAKNPLELLQLAADIYNGELVFHSIERRVDIVEKTGSDRGMVFHFRKNMKSMERSISTTSLITRLYATGKDGITFSNINNGLLYVDNFSYTDEILVGSLDCSNFMEVSDMLSFAKMRLADYCKPNYAYNLAVTYLERGCEIYGLGDIVKVIDEELELNIQTRIVRIEKDILEPWNTKIELSTTIGTLSLQDDNVAAQEAVDAVLKSFVAPRLVQATIDTKRREVNAMYELGIPIKYSYEETTDGIIFKHPDGLSCEIKVI